MDPPLLGGHLGERCLDHRLAALLPGRIQHVDFPDPAEFVEQRRDRALHAVAARFPLQQGAQRQRQHAAEHMHLDLLVRPVVLRADRDAVGVLELPEGALHMVLRAVAAHQFGVAPPGVVGEEQGLAQQRALQILPGLAPEAVAQRRQAVRRADLDREQVPHVARLQPAVDLLAGAGEAGLATAAQLAVPPAAELPLQAPQTLLALGGLAQQGPALGVEQRLVPGHQHCALGAEDLAPGAPGTDAGQPVGLQRAQPLGGDGQQVGMLGGHERADEMERAALDLREVLPGVVALVEDQRDALGGAGDLAAAPGEVGGEALEQGRVGAVAGIGAMQQRQAEVGRDEQRDAYDAQRLAALLAVAALGQRGALVEGVNVGEEVGGVEQHLAQVDAELAGHGGDEVAFDGLDRVGGDAVHVVPEALAGELGGADGEQSWEDGGVEPGCEGGLGAGGEAAVEDSCEQVGADGGAGAALGDVAVNVLGQAETAGEGEEGSAGTELAHDGLLGLGGGVGSLEFLDDAVGTAQVGLGDDLGLAVDALGDAGVVVGVPADDLLDEAGHSVRSYNSL